MHFKAEIDPTLLLRRPLAEVVKDAIDKDPLVIAERSAIADLIEERMEVICPDHHLPRYILTTCTPLAPAAQSLAELDQYIADVAEFFSRFSGVPIMLRLSQLMSLPIDEHTMEEADPDTLRRATIANFMSWATSVLAGKKITIALYKDRVFIAQRETMGPRALSFLIDLPNDGDDDDDDVDAPNPLAPNLVDA